MCFLKNVNDITKLMIYYFTVLAIVDTEHRLIE